jgi:hypothetical protein
MALDPLIVNEDFLPRGHLAQGMCNAVADPQLALVVRGVEVLLVVTPAILRMLLAPEGF